MSIDVKAIILHQLQRSQGDNDNIALQTKLRAQPLTVEDDILQMMLTLHQQYQSKAQAYGVFKQESIFAQQLNQYLESELDFLQFSQQSAQALSQELSQYHFAESGTFIFCHYTFLATQYLFIAFLDNRESVLVDEKLDIHQVSYLNMAQFDIAARINLTQLQHDASDKRYLSYLKGRVGRKVADFFMDFLGAEPGFDPKQQNLTLLQAIDDFCQQGELSSQQTQAVKHQTFDYCKGQMKAGEDIVLSELSDTLPLLNEQPFIEFSQAQEYDLSDHIPPVQSALKTLTKYSGAGKGVTISFDTALLGERIIWDEQSDTLLLKGLPANLRDQLQRFAKSENK
ncbi:nucleoid-associated protein YejK [Spirabiliibacterium falconis]|uniref:nucleoid-associated protein YejK n=1 Tax=Spirabiliibacterium falconis TaxID=572023 RepID=UPI001AAD5251|nr:nucleoid-associated protein YejK [Spirabiliibacterium falconis]MBE2895226.1 nucleoid-associated protein YejK [Spirabiliibacterium falconis]